MIEIKKYQEEEYEVIAIIGEVDASSSITLDNAINETKKAGANKILFDCTNLEYISSAGLGVFISYIEEFNRDKIRFTFFGMNDKVKNVFEILGLDQLLTICATKQEAKNKL